VSIFRAIIEFNPLATGSGRETGTEMLCAG